MTVLSTASALPGVCYVIAAILTVGGLVVVRKEFGRRTVALALIGIVLLVPVALSADDEEDDFVIRLRQCQLYERWSAEWWFWRCFLFDDGGEPPMNNLRMPVPADPVETPPAQGHDRTWSLR